MILLRGTASLSEPCVCVCLQGSAEHHVSDGGDHPAWRTHRHSRVENQQRNLQVWTRSACIDLKSDGLSEGTCWVWKSRIVSNVSWQVLLSITMSLSPSCCLGWLPSSAAAMRPISPWKKSCYCCGRPSWWVKVQLWTNSHKWLLCWRFCLCVSWRIPVHSGRVRAAAVQ